MDAKLKDAILRAQRKTRVAEGRETEEDIARQRRDDEMFALETFAKLALKCGSNRKINAVVESDGDRAVARFTVDGQAFTIRVDSSEYVLLAEDTELARTSMKMIQDAANKFLSAVGEYLQVADGRTGR